MAVRQRADLTFKHNKSHGRHGWLRLTPAYSVKIVRQVLAERPDARRILDPFSGTATTPLCAAEEGHTGVSVEINPFLVWLGNVKAAYYDEAALGRFDATVEPLRERALKTKGSPSDPPPIKSIQRWWSESSLEFLCYLKSGLDEHAEDRPVHDLLLASLCRTLIALSNAAFNHQSMSFKDPAKAKAKADAQLQLLGPPQEDPRGRQWTDDAAFILEAARANPEGRATVLRGDSRNLEALTEAEQEPFQLLVTSPPYPNRISYIRELRPYMYWLSYIIQAREAGELDWRAIGGTWGMATSRLKDWEPGKEHDLPEYIFPILEKVRDAHDKNGILLANYIHKYFEDIDLHIQAVRDHLEPGTEVHYIVGNSTFYGNLLPVERLYADLLTASGFEGSKWEVIRKRNSKKELFEFDVTATWPGA